MLNPEEVVGKGGGVLGGVLYAPRSENTGIPFRERRIVSLRYLTGSRRKMPGCSGPVPVFLRFIPAGFREWGKSCTTRPYT